MTHQAVVLVVEDHPLIRLNTVEVLETAGFEVLEASNADEAIALLQANVHIHLVFTDVEMPGSMDGLKLAHFVRDRWPPVKLIVASGKLLVEADDLPKGAQFFSKPYDDNKIVKAITAMLAEASAQSPGAGH